MELGPGPEPIGEGPQGRDGGGQPPHGSELAQQDAQEQGGGGRGGGWSTQRSTSPGPPPSTILSGPLPPRNSDLKSKNFFGSCGGLIWLFLFLPVVMNFINQLPTQSHYSLSPHWRKRHNEQVQKLSLVELTPTLTMTKLFIYGS